MSVEPAQPGRAISHVDQVRASLHGLAGRIIEVEPAAILEPSYRLDPAIAERLRRQQERVLGDAGQFTSAETFRLGCEFHECLVAGCGNPFAVDVVKPINSVRRLFAYRSLMPDRDTIRRQSREHLRLLELIAEGTRNDAAAFLRRHLEDAVQQACGLGI